MCLIRLPTISAASRIHFHYSTIPASGGLAFGSLRVMKKEVKDFLDDERLLFWLEALSLMWAVCLKTNEFSLCLGCRVMSSIRISPILLGILNALFEPLRPPSYTALRICPCPLFRSLPHDPGYSECLPKSFLAPHALPLFMSYSGL